jgi:inner membrane protein
MFIAHMPAGYLVTRYGLRGFGAHLANSRNLKYYVMFALLCSVLPDFDLIYFYLVDHRQHEHHSYWTHIPLFWVLFTALVYFGAKAFFKKNLGALCAILLANTQLHMLLDSVAGGIYWLYPFNSEKYRLFVITSRFDWWVFNYIFHWTFLLELTIIVTTAYVVWADRKLGTVKAVGQYER